MKKKQTAGRQPTADSLELVHVLVAVDNEYEYERPTIVHRIAKKQC